MNWTFFSGLTLIPEYVRKRKYFRNNLNKLTCKKQLSFCFKVPTFLNVTIPASLMQKSTLEYRMNSPRYLIILWILFLSSVILNSQCKSEIKPIITTISLTDLMKAQPDTFSNDGATLLNIIKVFPIRKECDVTTKYANLYICTKVSCGDTIYVFEECREVNKEAYDSNNYYPYIDKRNMTVPDSDKISVFVPNDFKLEKNIKYFYGHMDFFLAE